MKKTIIASVLAASVSTVAVAHESEQHHETVNISSESCNLKFQNKLSISPDLVTIDAQSGKVEIDQSGNLTVNGEVQQVSSNDQTLLSQYAQTVREQVPQVAEIAMDGVELAGVALSEVGEAFGISNMAAMDDMMNEVSGEIQNAFYEGGTFVMDEGRFDSIGKTFDTHFEEKLEDAMQSMMVESIGSLLITIGTEMVSSGGDMSEFEQRMERMGEQIEQKVELQAKNIEQRADQLCYDFKAIADQEDALQASIPLLKDYDVFQVKHSES